MTQSAQDIVSKWQEVPQQPDLSDEERAYLLQQLQPGMPMWKVLKSAFDFAQHMRDHIAETPLTGEAQISLARQLQMQRNAALSLLKWFVTCAQPNTQPAQDGTSHVS